jgi:WD40 repeat protein
LPLRPLEGKTPTQEAKSAAQRGFPQKPPRHALKHYKREAFSLEPRFGLRGRMQALAVSPTGDEALIGGLTPQIIHWLLNPARRIATRGGFKEKIRSISYSPDGRRFVVLEGAKTLSVWSRGGRLLRRWSSGELSLVRLRFVPVEDQLVALTEEGRLAIWAVAQGQLLRVEDPCPKSQALDWSVDAMQRRWGVACADQSLWLRSWGPSPHSQRQKLTASPTAIALNEEGTQIAIALQDHRIQLWRIAHDGKLAMTRERFGHLRTIRHLRFLEEAQTLLSAGDDHLLGIWSLQGGLSLQRFLQHEAPLVDLAWHPQRREIISLDQEGHLRIWKDLKTLSFLSEAPPAGGKSVAFSPDGKEILTDAEKGTAARWTLHNGQRELALTGLPSPLHHVAYAPDGNHAITVDAYNILFWDIRARRQIDVIRAPEGDEITATALGMDWTQAFYGTKRSGVFLWTIAGQRLLYRHSEPRYTTSVDLHIDRKLAAAGTSAGKIYLYDLATSQLQKTYTSPYGAITRLRFAPQGHQLLVLSGHYATLLNLPDLAPLQKHQSHAPLTSAAFLPQGSPLTLALGHSDATLSLWQPQEQVKTQALPVCDGLLRDLAPAPHAPLLAIACSDGSVRLWDLRTKALRWRAWSLPGKAWLALGEQGHLAASQEAKFYFFFSDGERLLTLDAFAGAWLDPLGLQKSLSPLSSPPKNPPR